LAINGAKNDRIARKRKMIEETKPRLCGFGVMYVAISLTKTEVEKFRFKQTRFCFLYHFSFSGDSIIFGAIDRQR
jgi:hypothetical protein